MLPHKERTSNPFLPAANRCRYLLCLVLSFATTYAQDSKQDRAYVEISPYMLTGNSTFGNDTQDMDQQFSFSIAANIPVSRTASFKVFMGNETSSYPISGTSLKVSTWRLGAVFKIFLD